MMSADWSDVCDRWLCGNCAMFLRNEPDEESGLGWSYGEVPEDNVYEVMETRVCRHCRTENENRR